MNKIAIILPAYNEEQTVAKTIEEFHSALLHAEIWVVNNRSSDQTEKIATNALVINKISGGVLNEPRPGKGNAVRRAFLEINADIYVLADADTTYPAEDVHNLIKHIDQGDADMVVGDRHSHGHYATENKRALHGFGNRLVRDLVNSLFHAKLADIMSGYRVLNRRFVKNYPILVEGFEIETDMTLHALDKRFRIKEIPVAYRDRPLGSVSKLNTLRDGARVLSTIGKILRYYRPLTFFGLSACIFAILGLAAGAPALIEYYQTSLVQHLPLAILATGLELIAFILFSIGLILDSLSHQDRRNFESSMLNQSWPQKPEKFK